MNTDMILQYIGAAYLIVSGLAVVVPKSTKLGSFLATIALDLKAFLPGGKP